MFFRDGNALDVFEPGRHTIATANIPLLIDLIGKAFNDRTPFPAEVYFVSMKEFANENGARRSRSSSATRAWAWAWHCCRALAPIRSR